MIILGGGMVKHHIANANLMVSRDGVCVLPSRGWHSGLSCRQACVLGLCHVLGRQLWTRQAKIPALLELMF